MRSEAYGDFAWVYDGPLGQPFAEAIAPDIERVIRGYLGHRRGNALDLACGTGLSTGFLRSMGFEPVGIDASLSMLAQASERNGLLVAADLRNLPVTGRFALVTCLYDSLNHMLEVRDLGRAMAEVTRVLDDDGLFLFDMNQPEVYAALWDSTEPFTYKARERDLRMETSFDEATRIATASITGSFATSRGRFRFSEIRKQRAWQFEEIAAAMSQAGLQIDTRLDFDPFEQARDSGIGIKWLIAAHR